MVGGDAAKFRGQFCPAEVRILVGVDFGFQPGGAASRENAARLVNGVIALVAEHVAELSQPALGDLRDHFMDDALDVSPAGRVAREVVRAEEGADHVNRLAGL